MDTSDHANEECDNPIIVNSKEDANEVARKFRNYS